MAVRTFTKVDNRDLVAEVKDPSRLRHLSDPHYGAGIEIECQDGDTGVYPGFVPKLAQIYATSQAANTRRDVDHWFAWTLELVSGPILDAEWSFLAELHSREPGGTQALTAYATPRGRLELRLWDAGSNAKTNHPILGPDGAQIVPRPGVRYSFLEHFIHSTDSAKGLFEGWCNGVPFVSRRFQTLYTQVVDANGTRAATRFANFPKWGFYNQKDTGTRVMRVYLIRVADTREEAIAGFPPTAGFSSDAGPTTEPPYQPAPLPESSFGSAGPGSRLLGSLADRPRATRFALPMRARITAMGANLARRGTGAERMHLCGWAPDGPGGEPGTLLFTSDELTTETVGERRVYEVAAVSPVLEPGPIWLGDHHGEGENHLLIGVEDEPGAQALGGEDRYADGTAPRFPGPVSRFDNRLAIYAVFRPEPVPLPKGSFGSAGPGTRLLGSLADRPRATRFELPTRARITAMGADLVRQGVGIERMRLCGWAADGPGGGPGTLLFVSDELSTETVDERRLHEVPAESPVLEPGPIWLGDHHGEGQNLLLIGVDDAPGEQALGGADRYAEGTGASFPGPVERFDNRLAIYAVFRTEPVPPLESSFGSSGPGARLMGAWADRPRATRFELPARGRITAMGADLVRRGEGIERMRLCAWAADGPGGGPGTLLVRSAELGTETVGERRLYEVPAESPVLEPGPIWLGDHHGEGQNNILIGVDDAPGEQALGGSDRYADGTGPSFPPPVRRFDNRLAIYAVFVAEPL